MSSLKASVRAALLRPFRHSRARRKARTENDRLLAMDVRLSAEHLSGTRVLPDRETMLTTLPQNGVVAEVGVADGRFSECILELNKPSRLYLIDAWAMPNHPQYGEGGHRLIARKFESQISAGLIEVRRGMSWDMLEELPDDHLDWIYIDAAHSYDAVRKDLEVARRKTKDEGFIAGHDYVRWGRFGARFGVLEAVNEFCIQHRYAFAFLSLESNLNWSYALRKMP
jgi:hypothetical protein